MIKPFPSPLSKVALTIIFLVLSVSAEGQNGESSIASVDLQQCLQGVWRSNEPMTVKHLMENSQGISQRSLNALAEGFFGLLHIEFTGDRYTSYMGVVNSEEKVFLPYRFFPQSQE